MSDAKLQIIAQARTPAEHAMLIEYFTTLAARYTVDAGTCAAMAAGYRGNPRPGISSAAVQTDRLASQAREAAAAAIADRHQLPKGLEREDEGPRETKDCQCGRACGKSRTARRRFSGESAAR